MRDRACSRWLPLLAMTLSLAPPASGLVTIDWVSVGDPGNDCDPQVQGCFGAVAHDYQIAKYETTNAQYAEFLNAVAATDTNGLYNTEMASILVGGITRSGSQGTYSYEVMAGRESMPVNYVSFYDALRFANWLHNGQPVGAQDGSTTEGGAYTITAAGITANTIARNADASIFLTSENEWYKAAYFDAVAASYFDYPAGSDAFTRCAAPTATPNRANCEDVVGSVTAVGSYTGSASPFGTYDQGGNVMEWMEAISGSTRVVRGGDYEVLRDSLSASVRHVNNPTGRYSEGANVGFRVATVIPEPGTGLLVMTGLLALASWQRGARRID